MITLPAEDGGGGRVFVVGRIPPVFKVAPRLILGGVGRGLAELVGRLKLPNLEVVFGGVGRGLGLNVLEGRPELVFCGWNLPVLA